jgi:choline dehydrogenase-like flavoprotein
MFMFTKKYDWSYEAKSDPKLRDGHPLFCARGKTLGGSSSINGMVYTSGHRSDYDGWAALGNSGKMLTAAGIKVRDSSPEFALTHQKSMVIERCYRVHRIPQLGDP